MTNELRYINHSDEPNAAYCDDLTVVALRDIHPGQEIVHNYENDGEIEFDEPDDENESGEGEETAEIEAEAEAEGEPEAETEGPDAEDPAPAGSSGSAEMHVPAASGRVAVSDDGAA